MATVGAFEAKNTLGSLLDRVEKGEEITITRHGRPVATLVPLSGAAPGTFDKKAADAAVEAIREMRKGVTIGSLTIRELIDEGRR